MVGIKATLFGKIAVQTGMITDEQLQLALRKQVELEAHDGDAPRIGEILREMGFLADTQILAVLARMAGDTRKAGHAPPRFGEIAASFGLVQPTDVKEALRVQRRRRTEAGTAPKLGELLVELGRLMPHQVTAVLTEQEKKVVECPVCGAGINIQRFEVNKRVRCGSCNGVLVVQRDNELVLDPSSTQAGQTRVQQKIGEFFVEVRLGQDAISKTYRCVDSRDGNTVAIKVFSKVAIAEHDIGRELLEGIRKTAELRHRNLRRLYSMGRHHGRPYVVMEFFEGLSLLGILTKQERVPQDKAISVLVQTLEALDYMHGAGLVHGDIRPSNLLLTSGGVLKLAGVGMSPKVTDNILNVVASGEVTPFYFAPELVASEGGPGTAADIYGLGACIYHALTGRPPFAGKSPFEVLIRLAEDSLTPIRETVPDVSPALARIVERMVEPELAARFPTAQSVLAALKRTPEKEPAPIDLLPSEDEMRPERLIEEGSNVLHNLDAGLPVYYKMRSKRAHDEEAFGAKHLLIVVGVAAALLIVALIVAGL